MDLDALRTSPIGQLVPITGSDARVGEYNYWAYLPGPLPDEPDIDQATWAAVSDASRALGRLHQACALLPNPELLIAPALVREALDTSALEGTFGALADVLEARLPGQRSSTPETREIRAYEEMAKQGFEWVREGRPISIGMLAELQGILAAGSRTPTRDPGKVREHQVFIGSASAQTIEDARYVPPPPDDRLKSGLDAWQRWIGERSDLATPVRVAIGHYQFESLHPFGDGNGRIGRLTMVLQLLADGTISEPALTLSQWFLKHRGEYQAHLLTVSQTGDFNPWITFCCKAICEQCERSVDAAVKLMHWLEAVRQQLSERHWSGTVLAIASALIDWPVITMSFAAERLGVSVPTAKSAIDRLVSIGVLEELTGKSYGRAFGARDVMRIVESM